MWLMRRYCAKLRARGIEVSCKMLTQANAPRLPQADGYFAWLPGGDLYRPLQLEPQARTATIRLASHATPQHASHHITMDNSDHGGGVLAVARLLLDELVRRGASASIFLNFDLSQRHEMLALRSLLPYLTLLPMWDTATLPIVPHAEPQVRSKNLAGHEP